MVENIDDELKALRMRRLQQLIAGDSLNQETENWPGSPIPVTDVSLQDFIDQYPLVVLDCWAPWCGPCRSLAPVFESLAQEYQGKIVFGKLNVDENQRTAAKYQTMSIPTLLIFKDGKPVDRIVGALPKQAIEEKLKVHLNSGE
jgi:thioredoxin 1